MNARGKNIIHGTFFTDHADAHKYGEREREADKHQTMICTYFFFLKLIKTNVLIPQNFKCNENLTIFKFW